MSKSTYPVGRMTWDQMEARFAKLREPMGRLPIDGHTTRWSIHVHLFRSRGGPRFSLYTHHYYYWWRRRGPQYQPRGKGSRANGGGG